MWCLHITMSRCQHIFQILPHAYNSFKIVGDSKTILKATSHASINEEIGQIGFGLGRVEITRTGRCNAAKCFDKFCLND